MSPEEYHLVCTASKLRADNGGHWGEHPNAPIANWQYEVANGDTRLGYWEWVAATLGEAQA